MPPLPERVRAGAPSGGQFITARRGESALALAERGSTRLDLEDLYLPSGSPPRGTDDPEGSFSRCKEVSAEYTEHLRAHGIDAEWVQVCGPGGYFPDAQEEWKGVAQEFWQHYVTRVPVPGSSRDLDDPTAWAYVDFTARQFDPGAEHPQVTCVADADWADTYPLAADVLDRYLTSWRAEHRP